MKLDEILDSAYEYKLKKNGEGMIGSFKNADGQKVTVIFEAYHIPNTGWSYQISFGIKDDTDLTGKGDEFKTFGTVMKIIDEFLVIKSPWNAKHPPRLIFFTSDSDSRNKLYTKLMNRLLSKFPKFRKVSADQLPPEVYKWWQGIDFEGKAVQIVTDLK